MSIVTFLKAFPRKKRVDIVDMLRGAYPVPIDFKELNMIGQILELDKMIFIIFGKKELNKSLKPTE